MQVGSKVVCVDDVFPEWVPRLYRELPVKGTVYTVRLVRLGRTEPMVIENGKLVKNGGSEKSPTVGILVHELHNPDDPWGPTNNKGGMELGFNAERFREVEETTETEERVEEEPMLVPTHTVPARIDPKPQTLPAPEWEYAH